MKDSQETSKIQNMNPDEAKVELSKNNPAYANYLKGLSEGRFQLAGRSTKSSIQIQKDLANLYPNMDQSKIQARYKTRQDFTTGTAAKNVKSLNTAVSHLNEMNKLIPELHNSGFKMWNRLAQTGSREVGGNPTLARFGAVKTALSGELANIFKNSGGTDQEIKHVADTIDSADSPEALKASIGESINLMGGRLSALQDQWHNAFDQSYDKDFPVISDRSKNILSSMGYDQTNNSSENKSDSTATGQGQTGDYQSYLKAIGQ